MVIVERLADVFEFALEDTIVELIFIEFHEQSYLLLQVLGRDLYFLFGEVIGQSVRIFAIYRYFISYPAAKPSACVLRVNIANNC